MMILQNKGEGKQADESVKQVAKLFLKIKLQE